MARPDKAAAVAEITEAFRSSSAALLTEYRGLTVAQLKELRRTLSADATYAVVKNTLGRIAAREAGLGMLEPLLEGPSAIAFVTGDPVTVAKGIRDFARGNPALIVKGGVLDGRELTADEIRRLADLESREVLLAKLAGAMKASLSQAVGLFAAPLAQVARLIGALEQKAAVDPSIIGGRGAAEASPEASDAEDGAATETASDEADAAAEASDAEDGAATETASDEADAAAEASDAEDGAESPPDPQPDHVPPAATGDAGPGAEPDA